MPPSGHRSGSLDQVADDSIRERLDECHAERERIARELHDSLLQGIQALLFRLQIWAADTGIASERRGEIAAVVVQARGHCRGRQRVPARRAAQAGGVGE